MLYLLLLNQDQTNFTYKFLLNYRFMFTIIGMVWYGIWAQRLTPWDEKLKGLWEADRVGLEKGTKMETRASL